MRRCLVDRLACPRCQGSVDIGDVLEENAIRIVRGTLRCRSCGRLYPIGSGVPRLVAEVPDDQAEVGRRFSLQWMARWNGQFEGRRCYGLDDDAYVGWLIEQLQARRAAAPGAWMLDCGCGSGEKAAALAHRCPEQHVVGLDLGVNALEEALARFGDRSNLDYLQGDIMRPPLKPRQFACGISLGVLHHTADTRRAFGRFRRLLTDEASCVLFIYPPYREGPEWWGVYFVRDFLLLGQGSRLPVGALRGLAQALLFTFFPLFDLAYKRSGRRLHKDLPFVDIDRMTRKERYEAQVFFGVDTCLPRYQHRHPVEEVKRWFAEEGLEPMVSAHGFYSASSVSAHR